MSRRVYHPACGKSFNNSNTEGHCAACCETFVGLEAFDKHRLGGRCNTTMADSAKFWQDDEERWHYGRRMTDAEKARAFGAAAP